MATARLARPFAVVLTVLAAVLGAIALPAATSAAPGLSLSEVQARVSALNEQHEHQGLFYFKRPNGQSAVVAYRNKLLQLPGTEPIVLSHGIDMSLRFR